MIFDLNRNYLVAGERFDLPQDDVEELRKEIDPPVDTIN
jgi:hypothetical protein